MKSEEGRGASGSGGGLALGGFPSNSPGNGGGILGGAVPSKVNGTAVPDILPIIDTSEAAQWGGQTPITPASLPTAQLQALLNAQVSDAGVPGAILAVQTKDGVWIGAAGKADVGANAPMTPDMQVRLAGVTKVFTAALIMKLVEENKIALTDTVQKWLPALIVPGTVPFSAQITVAMLLNHTSGLYDYVGDQFFTDLLLSDPHYAWPSDSTYDEIIYWIYDTAFLPGTAVEYCNAGYYLLGKIAEAATGDTDTVENMVKTRFFDPLTMSKTTLTRSGQFQTTEPYTRGYCWIDPNYYPTLVDTAKLVDTSDWDLSWDWTSGSGVSTAQDMLTWTRALFGGQVVNAQSLTQMTTPNATANTYGFGLEVVDSDPWFGEKMYSHSGENPGVVARWLYYPDSGRTIFIILNRFDSYAPSQMDASLAADSILSGISSILLNKTP
jgi:D-alanyl-D-alanine carboxypeptidase